MHLDLGILTKGGLGATSVGLDMAGYPATNPPNGVEGAGMAPQVTPAGSRSMPKVPTDFFSPDG